MSFVDYESLLKAKKEATGHLESAVRGTEGSGWMAASQMRDGNNDTHSPWSDSQLFRSMVVCQQHTPPLPARLLHLLLFLRLNRRILRVVLADRQQSR